jgi:hypothetical protein
MLLARAEADAAVRVADQVEFLSQADGGAVGDQHAGPAVVGADVIGVGMRPQTDAAVGVVDQVEFLSQADGGAVGDQRAGPAVLRGDVPAVGIAPAG